MTKFEIIPYQGVNKIRFQMSREEVRKILGGKVNEYRDLYLIDSFQNNESLGNIRIWYSYQFPHPCKAFEISPPHQAIFEGKDLLRTSIEDLMKWFESMDGDVVGDDTEAITYRFGIFLWAGGDPLARFSAEDCDEELTEEEALTAATWAQAVTVFERGFYDGHREYLTSRLKDTLPPVETPEEIFASGSPKEIIEVLRTVIDQEQNRDSNQDFV